MLHHLLVIALVISMNPPGAAAADVGTIYGVGYREVERDVPRTSIFSSTKEDGVTEAS